MKTAILYTLFAGIAMAINLATQMLVVAILAGRYEIPLSILAGTVAGIAVKYVLDKKYIFRVVHSKLDQHVRAAGFYLLASIATTVIFWGTEAAFHFAFDSSAMRYLGGAIGLAIGYVTKYQLDKRFAFS